MGWSPQTFYSTSLSDFLAASDGWRRAHSSSKTQAPTREEALAARAAREEMLRRRDKYIRASRERNAKLEQERKTRRKR